MSGLHILIYLITLLMIYAIGRRQHHECRRRREWELDAAQDRDNIRAVAETAASDAASCVAVIDRIPAPAASRRRLHAVRDDSRGVSAWQWE